MLKLVDITKEYKVDKEGVLALCGVSIEFRRNEFVSILGPSGCGKTTLLNIIGGLDRYTSGDIQIDGVSTKQYDDIDWDTYRNRRIGFVFQSYNLIPHLSILKNVSMSLTLAGVEREERIRRAMEALEKVGLASQARKKPNQLSGGQMQRVAIARALVNNPEIILADEPTGALDSESGIQVMDLLKEVAKDRLVIMVTHNPTLAEEYSTRIVYLKDGRIEGDTMPYVSEDVQPKDETLPEEDAIEQTVVATDEAHEQTETLTDEAQGQAEVANDEAQGQAKEDKPQKKPSKIATFFKKVKEKCARLRHQEKSAMKLRTAINLSWTNLLSKKGRTLLTSIAGSIGIIGIVVVLALSNGATMYIRGLEESSLSSYPILVTETNMDMNTVMTMLTKEDELSQGREEFPDSHTIYTEKLLGKVIDNWETLWFTNELEPFKKYIDKNFDKSLAIIKYGYGVEFNAYIRNPNPDSKYDYMKVNPYTEVMQNVLDEVKAKVGDITIGGMSFDQAVNMLTSTDGGMFNAWTEMSDNQEMLESQYDLVDGHWPVNATDLVVVVDSKNQLLDYQLFMLGLMSQDDVIQALMNSNFATQTRTTEDLLGLEYVLMTNADYLYKAEDGEEGSIGKWKAYDHGIQDKEVIEAHMANHPDMIAKVVGVVRPKPGATVTSINGVLGYTSKLTKLLYNKAKAHPVVQELLKAASTTLESDTKQPYENVWLDYEATSQYRDDKGNPFKTTYGDWFDADDHETLMRALGVVLNEDKPKSIEFYCTSFDSKEQVEAFIDRYNTENGQNIQPGDTLGVMMSFVNTMATTITGVLVAFAAISLIVSTIMIAIIIYTSVLERRKEIGVLRSIGARKKDISRVFIAESAILGAYSGIIGIIISVIISAIGSFILGDVLNIGNLLTVKWWHCVLMFLISVLLSIFAGFIPSRIAAKKDPAIALRSE